MALISTYVCDQFNKPNNDVTTRVCGERAQHTCALCTGHFCDKHAACTITLSAGVSIAMLTTSPSRPFNGDVAVMHTLYADEKVQPPLAGERIESRICEDCQHHVRRSIHQSTSETLAATLAPAHAEFVKQCAAAIAAMMLK